MRRVMAEVDLKELGINIEKTRRTASGGILLEVMDKEKAAALTTKLRSVVGDDAPVYSPTRTTPVLVLGIPDWMEHEQVINDIG